MTYSYKSILDRAAFRELRISSLNLPKSIAYFNLRERYELGAYMAHIRGALLHLFGEPLEASSDLDEAFFYLIEATNPEGQIWKLAVYQISSGVVIGGDATDLS